ncbi:MAG: hypothetical protein JSU86_10480 [Phycisphaerales bacterium]|nr:MAG: hypothetical protein JSU86_10480 [Phycisphaerales bacterium]
MWDHRSIQELGGLLTAAQAGIAFTGAGIRWKPDSAGLGVLAPALAQAADVSSADGPTSHHVLCIQEPKCFLPNLHSPDPSLTKVIGWGLRDAEPTTRSEHADADLRVV